MIQEKINFSGRKLAMVVFLITLMYLGPLGSALIKAQVEENPERRDFIKIGLFGQRWSTIDTNTNNKGVLTLGHKTEATPLIVPFPLSYGQMGDYYMWEIRLGAMAAPNKVVQTYADFWGYFKTYSRWSRSAFYIGGGLGYYRLVEKFPDLEVQVNYSGLQAGWGFGGLIGTENKKAYVDIAVRYYFAVGNPVRVIAETDEAVSIQRRINNAYDISFSFVRVF